VWKGAPKPIYEQQPHPLEALPELVNKLYKMGLGVVRGKKMIVEFLLPMELLHLPIYEWPVKTWQIEKPLGIESVVVVRSLERLELRSTDLPRVEWNERWRGWWGYRAQLHHQFTELLPDFENYEQVETYSRLKNAKHVACLVIAQPITPEVRVLNNFLALLEAGIPIAIWPSHGSVDSSFLEAVNQLLTEYAPSELPSALLGKRGDAKANQAPTIWADLVLFWDDPDRRPPEHDIDADSFYSPDQEVML
jgi:hypothetical protein